MRVLIIDDDANIRRMMRLTLESEHEVHDAGRRRGAAGAGRRQTPSMSSSSIRRCPGRPVFS